MPVEPLTALAPGLPVFLDANVLTYALLDRSDECKALLERCQEEEVYGVTTFAVVNEVTHKLMLHEATEAGIIVEPRATLLRKHIARIPELTRYWEQTERVLEMNIARLRVEQDLLPLAHDVRSQCGLMTNDSLIVATMQANGIDCVASDDTDFDHIAMVTRYAPQDVAST